MNFMKPCRFREFLIQLCKKKRFFLALCRNITVPSYCHSGFLCRAFLRGCAVIIVFGEIFTSGWTTPVRVISTSSTMLSVMTSMKLLTVILSFISVNPIDVVFDFPN